MNLWSAILITFIPSQYCRDLAKGERLICNQIYEVNQKLDKVVSVQAEMVRTMDNHELRLINAETSLIEHKTGLRSLYQFRDESSGQRRAEAGIVALLTGLVMALANRTLAKRDKANGRG